MTNDDLVIRIIEFNNVDPMRIHHFLKVYEFAHVIGDLIAVGTPVNQEID